MKMQTRSFTSGWALLALSLTFICQLSTGLAQGTAFNYQGQLQSGGSPANGTYNLVFSLYATNVTGTAIAGPVTNNGVAVANGLFTVSIDFGSSVWNGGTNWLQIAVETNGASSYSGLSPRQQMNPVPYAIYSESASGLTGLVVQNNINGAPNLIGGSPLNYVSSGVIGATIGGGGSTADAYSNSVTADFGAVGGGVQNTAGSDWATVAGGFGNTASGASSAVLGGNFNTANNYTAVVGGGIFNVAGGTAAFVGGGGYDGINYLGNQALGNASFVGGGLDNLASNLYSAVVAGYSNSASGIGAFIGGGGYDGSSYQGNQVAGNAAFIGGGINNNINPGANYAAVVSGQGNLIDVSSYNSTIVGGELNTIGENTDHSFIGGGSGNGILLFNGTGDTIGGGENNGMSAPYIWDSVISGGDANEIGGNYDTVGGGQDNLATNSYATVGGGVNNLASGQSATVAGGGMILVLADGPKPSPAFRAFGGNTASGNYSSIGGGESNDATNTLSVVSGGGNNTSGGYASTVPGGANNLATGNYSYAAGNNAQATNNYSFVWSDGSATTGSATNNQFVARADNGFVFLTSSGNLTGVMLAPGATSWATLSDRNAKKDFAPVDAQAILDKLVAVPIQQWHYKWESDGGAPNLGPMAQDFIHTFYPGRDDKHITTLEFDGVELAAIQGLNQKLEEQSREKNAEIDQLRQTVAQLSEMMKKLAANQKQMEAK